MLQVHCEDLELVGVRVCRFSNSSPEQVLVLGLTAGHHVSVRLASRGDKGHQRGERCVRVDGGADPGVEIGPDHWPVGRVGVVDLISVTAPNPTACIRTIAYVADAEVEGSG